MDNKIDKFLKCPESSCNNDNVKLDYYKSGDDLFIVFNCLNCGCSASEDDFKWFVMCPKCCSNSTTCDSMTCDIRSNGTIMFKCQKCNKSVVDRVKTRWDKSKKETEFEPDIWKADSNTN